MRLPSGQQDGDQAPFSICECVDLRVAPSARTANSLLLLPHFLPAAERWALTCVESIICISADRPLPASSRNRFSQTPRRAQRTKRLWIVVDGPYASGQSHHRQPLLRICTIPLITPPIVHAFDAAHIRRQMRLNPCPRLVAQPKQIPAHEFFPQIRIIIVLSERKD